MDNTIRIIERDNLIEVGGKSHNSEPIRYYRDTYQDLSIFLGGHKVTIFSLGKVLYSTNLKYEYINLVTK